MGILAEADRRILERIGYGNGRRGERVVRCLENCRRRGGGEQDAADAARSGGRSRQTGEYHLSGGQSVTETVRHPGESAALCGDPVDGGSPAERRQRISGHALLRGGYDAAAARRLCSLPDRPRTAAHSG